VSHQTVSRVINGHPSVLPATRQRVQSAIEQLGYRRNYAARALATSRTDVLGVVVVSTNLYGPSRTLLGIEQAAREAGYWVSVASVDADSGTQTETAISHFMDQGVDGVAVVAQTAVAVRAAARMSGSRPMVLVASAPVRSSQAAAGLVEIDIDQWLGAELAVQHLLELGHRSVAHITGPAKDLHSQARTNSWRRVLAEAGLPEGPLLAGDWSGESGYQAGRELAQLEPLPTAVFVGNDTMAQGVLRALWEAGVSVPGDISVVGFDDSPGVDQAIPPLTTVRQDHVALGAACLERLIALIEGRPAEGFLLSPNLVVRASTLRPA
jgi:DNA-binding LacI/PurR family transcriptional regulator